MQLEQLAKIMTIPEGATSFHTERGKAVFLIGAKGTFVEQELTPEQAGKLQSAGAMGSFGQPIEA